MLNSLKGFRELYMQYSHNKVNLTLFIVALICIKQVINYLIQKLWSRLLWSFRKRGHLLQMPHAALPPWTQYICTHLIPTIHLLTSSYVNIFFHLIWDRSQLYIITETIPLLLQLTLAPPQSHAIITISSLLQDKANT